eukprot:716243-Hanusia_phi.AAC.1
MATHTGGGLQAMQGPASLELQAMQGPASLELQAMADTQSLDSQHMPHSSSQLDSISDGISDNNCNIGIVSEHQGNGIPVTGLSAQNIVSLASELKNEEELCNQLVILNHRPSEIKCADICPTPERLTGIPENVDDSFLYELPALNEMLEQVEVTLMSSCHRNLHPRFSPKDQALLLLQAAGSVAFRAWMLCSRVDLNISAEVERVIDQRRIVFSVCGDDFELKELHLPFEAAIGSSPGSALKAFKNRLGRQTNRVLRDQTVPRANYTRNDFTNDLHNAITRAALVTEKHKLGEDGNYTNNFKDSVYHDNLRSRYVLKLVFSPLAVQKLKLVNENKRLEMATKRSHRELDEVEQAESCSKVLRRKMSD